VNTFRRRVRVVAIAWLLCQVASLSAFVPEECCVSHAAEEAAKAKAEECHETPAPEPKPGDACPMHHGEKKTHDCCVISNTCDGPGTHLAGLFAYSGMLETPASSAVVLDSVAADVAAPPPLLHRLALPDAPPPKA
jgi:hypothetical protein